MREPVIIIEHLEKRLGLWIFLEYRHSSLMVGRKRLWFTNVPKRYYSLLKRYGYVYEESIVELVSRGIVPRDKIIILDPDAEKPLEYSDLEGSYIVIGGILGDHPPRKRTKKLLTQRLPGVKTRNIGNGQYSIDGAVYYVQYLWENRTLSGFRYIDGVTIETHNGYIRLPFRYPLKNNKPVIAPGLIEYLTGKPLPEHILKEIKLSK